MIISKKNLSVFSILLFNIIFFKKLLFTASLPGNDLMRYGDPCLGAGLLFVLIRSVIANPYLAYNLLFVLLNIANCLSLFSLLINLNVRIRVAVLITLCCLTCWFNISNFDNLN